MRFLAGRSIGVVVLIASLIAVGLSAASTIRTHDYAVCQQHYNEVTNERLRILTEVGAKERDAQRRRDDALDATFLDPSLSKPSSQRTPAEQRRVQDLFAEYLAAAAALRAERAAADQARAANPLPPPPSQAC